MSLPIPSNPVLVFLASLAIQPRPSRELFHPRTLLWPLTLLSQNPEDLAHLPAASLRAISIARAVEGYVLAWLFLGVLSAILRTAGRIRSRFTDTSDDNGADGLQVKRILGVRPLLRAAVWHLVAWRLVILPTAAVGGVGSGWSVPTFVGIAGGLMAGVEEMFRLLELFGWGKAANLGIALIGMTPRLDGPSVANDSSLLSFLSSSPQGLYLANGHLRPTLREMSIPGPISSLDGLFHTQTKNAAIDYIGTVIDHRSRIADTIALFHVDPESGSLPKPVGILFLQFLKAKATYHLPSTVLEPSLQMQLRDQAMMAITSRSAELIPLMPTIFFTRGLSLIDTRDKLFQNVDVIIGDATGLPLEPTSEPSLFICLSDIEVAEHQKVNLPSLTSAMINLAPGDAILLHPDAVQTGGTGDETSCYLRLYSKPTPPPSIPSAPPSTFELEHEELSRAITVEVATEVAAMFGPQRMEQKATKAEMAKEEKAMPPSAEGTARRKRIKEKKELVKKKEEETKRRLELAVAKEQAELEAEEMAIKGKRKKLDTRKKKDQMEIAEEAELDRLLGITSAARVPARSKKGTTRKATTTDAHSATEGISDVEDEPTLTGSSSEHGRSSRGSTSSAGSKRKAAEDPKTAAGRTTRGGRGF